MEETINTIVQAVVFIYLIFEGITDYRYKSVAVKPIILFGFLEILCGFFVLHMEPVAMLLGAVPGACMMLFSKGTGGVIGMGDGAVICVAGILSGALGILMVILLGGFLAAMVSAFLLVLRRVRLKQEIPFLPFVAAGYLGVMLCV